MALNDSMRDEDRFAGERAWEIDNGWDVFGADGEKLGDVQEVHPQYFVVSKGFFFPTERYVPVSAIANVERQRVYLNVTKEQVDNLDWNTAPETDDVVATADAAGVGGYTGSPATVTDEAYTDRSERSERETLSVPVVEEEVNVRARPVERGAVRVHKDVIEDTETVNVPLREEEIVVDRRPVDRAVDADNVPTDAFQDADIEIPLRGEEVDVSKRPVVREEVDISRSVQERTERVSEPVRREEVHVDEVGDVERGKRS